MEMRPSCPTEGITKILKVSLTLYFGSLVHTVVTNWQKSSQVGDLMVEHGPEDASLYLSEAHQLSNTTLSNFLALVYWVVLLFFVARVARAASDLGAQGLRYTPKRAVWGYIIPVVNFYRPYQAMREAWQVSDPRSTESNWSSLGGYGWVRLWWGLYLSAIVVGLLFGISSGLDLDLQGTALGLRVSLQYDAVIESIAGVNALVMLTMVKNISDRMQAKWDLRFGPASVPEAKVQQS